MASSSEIRQILEDIRFALDHNMFQPINRRKNLNTLSQLGLTWEDAKNEIYTLSETNYHSGPSIDRDRPSSDLFWIFKKRVLGEVLYIKFKVLYQEDGSVKLVSFHIDE